MGRKAEEKLSRFVADLVRIGSAQLVKDLAIDEAAAAAAMRIAAHEICRVYARTYIYVPLDQEYELSARDKEMWEQYSTDSSTAFKFSEARVVEIAAKYQLTKKQVYSIVALMRRRDRESKAKAWMELQGNLPL